MLFPYGSQITRREWIRTGLGAAAAIAGRGILDGAPQRSSDTDIVLTNGKFVDGRGVVGSRLTIKNGRIVNVGQIAAAGAGVRTIDLSGRTVIPGFVDAHVHYTRGG